MKISVIIPSYKPKEYLWECLDSLVAQTLPYQDWELIFVLNGCKEPWEQEIRAYIGRNMHDVNVVFIQTDSPGVSNARNIALDKVRGDFITFIDDDDYVSNRYLESMYEVTTSKSVVLADSRSFVDGSDEVSTDYRVHKIFKRCQESNTQSLLYARSLFNGPCMKLFPKSFLQGHRFDVRFKNGEDNLYMFLISHNIKLLRYAENSIYFRRFRDSSALTRKRPFSEKFLNTMRLMKQYTIYVLQHPFRYNYPFVISRYAAELKSLFY